MIDHCEYLQNVANLLAEKKISENLANSMLKSFDNMINSMKEIEINHSNNLKEIEISRNNNQKEMLQLRCTTNGMKVTSMERTIKVAEAITVGCNTMTNFNNEPFTIDNNGMCDETLPPLK